MLINVFREEFRYPPRFAPFAPLIAPGFFIDVGHLCNFRCVFCSVRREDRFFPLDKVLDEVRMAGKHGLGQGFFTGGEPTVHPYLEEIMHCGNRHGVTHYGMSTNGWGLTDERRVQELAKLGMTVWKLSWDDHRPDVLDELRGHRNVTGLMLQALDNLHRFSGGVVGVYQVLVAQNCARLPEMVAFLADLRKTYPKLAFLVSALVKPVEDALSHPEVLFDPAEAMPFIRAAIEVADARSFPLAFNNLPACLIPQYPEQACSTWEHLGIFDTDTGVVSPMCFDFAQLTKGPPCLGCRHFERCNGYFTANAERFGDSIYLPSGPLLRAEPLPDDLLPRATEVTANGLANVDPPGDRAAAEPASDTPVPEAEPRPLPAQMQRGLAAALPAGWRLHRCQLSPASGPPELQTHVARVPDEQPLIVFVAPVSAGKPAYAATDRLLVWHGGNQLTPAQTPVLDALVRFFLENEAEVLDLLTL